MNYIVIFLLLTVNVVYGDESWKVFNALRERHTKTIAATNFTADMDKKSATYILKNQIKGEYVAQESKSNFNLVPRKLKGEYVVEVNYAVTEGIRLKVKGEDPFYENIMYSYELFLNMLLLPVLSNSSYTRLSKKMDVMLLRDEEYQLEYKRGDDLIRYIFSEGKNGLIKDVQYFENGKKEFALDISWSLVQDKYVPSYIKTVSYIKTRQPFGFAIQNFKIK